MAASAAMLAARVAASASFTSSSMRVRVLGEVGVDRLLIRRHVEVAHLEQLVGDVRVGAVADDAEHRPRDPASSQRCGDGGGLHVERHHALLAELGHAVRIGGEPDGGEHLPLRRPLAEVGRVGARRR